MSIDLFTPKSPTELLKDQIFGLIETYFSKIDRGRRQWRDKDVAAIEPFIPGLSLIVSEIDPNFELTIGDGFYRLKVNFENSIFYINSSETFIEHLSYGESGNLNVKHLFLLDELALECDGVELEILEKFLLKLHQIMEAYLSQLREGNMDFLLLLRNRSLEIRKREKNITE